MYFGLVGVLEFMGLKVGEASLSSCFAPPTQAQVRHINFLLLPHTYTYISFSWSSYPSTRKQAKATEQAGQHFTPKPLPHHRDLA